MKYKEVSEYISTWLNNYLLKSNLDGFTIGISGGIDSAVTSALAARTGKPTLVLEMPIHQQASQVKRAKDHIAWLKNNFSNVSSLVVDLTSTFDTFIEIVGGNEEVENQFLALANARARLRMTTLYYYAAVNRYIVTGTGNKVEDFGVGFYTKYGDGGVDVSPIADLMKSEVFSLAKEIGIISSIQKAAPTDGLWEDNRTDEDQLGASYDELEWAMNNMKGKKADDFIGREKEVFMIFSKLNAANKHKMNPIPVCEIPSNLK